MLKITKLFGYTKYKNKQLTFLKKRYLMIKVYKLYFSHKNTRDLQIKKRSVL